MVEETFNKWSDPFLQWLLSHGIKIIAIAFIAWILNKILVRIIERAVRIAVVADGIMSEEATEIINLTGLALAEDPGYKEFILQPPQFLRINDFADSSIILKILGETKPLKQWEITGEVRRRLKKAFDENGIEIPFPQRVIHQAKF